MRVNGLFGHVDDNDKRSLYLFGAFIIAIHLLAMVVLFLPLAIFDPAHAPIYSWGGYATRYIIPVTLAAALLFVCQMFWHVHTVRRQSHYHYVNPAMEPRLCRIIAPLARSVGLNNLRAGVMESPAMNAFACGISRDKAVVVVTRGLIDRLDDEELGAVIAHELTHILNGDTRLMAAANVCLSNLRLVQSNNPLRIHDYRQAILIFFVPIFFPLFMIGGFFTQGAFRLAYWARLSISNAREFIADAEAVRMTHNPAALISALRKIEGRSHVPDLPPEQDAMMIDGAAEGAMATHPTIAARIATLMKLTGGMATISHSHKDTREGEIAAGFGRRRTVSTLTPTPAWDGYVGGNDEIANNAYDRAMTGYDRNMFGMNDTHSYMVLGAVLLTGLMHFNNPAALAARFNVLTMTSSMRGMMPGSGVDQMDAASVFITGKPTPEHHPNVQEVGGTFSRQSGSADAVEARPRPQVPSVDLTYVQKNKCFWSEGYEVGDGSSVKALSAPTREGPMLPDILSRLASAGFEVWMVPADKQDAELKSYVTTVQFSSLVIHRNYGKAGLDIFREALDDPAHLKIVDRISERMNDPSFTADMVPLERAGWQALIAQPTNVISCIAHRNGD